MNTGEKDNQPPEPKRIRFIVGGKRRSDGTMDYSQAMEIPDPEGKFEQQIAAAELRTRTERAKRFEIPEYVKPGSASMVWYTMRNTIMVNEEVAEKARQDGTPDKRLEALIKSQKMQQTIDGNTTTKFSGDLIKESLKTGKIMTAEQAHERARNLTADEMHDLVQKYIVDHYEDLQNKGHEEAYLQQGHFGGNYPIKDLLKTARDLQRRLIDEASRGGKS